ncbi:hypothetical protein CYLTODRAFT_425811 [Cylindrobasidium torrendii FP15055 ss-10]|uniref:Uncharacterized protein n=1 Tax=Cylindrobasidium torrendii FP15055 ss-10 TaxID=1314674 RepID=A0A0D7AZY6_9AGAR|nr:hypothetical protein CYLTODRAFT_425811 [Cylindrobasidium torrendii FP15055 ss-10]
MGGADSFCGLTGGCYFETNDVYPRAIEDAYKYWLEDNPDTQPDRERIVKPPVEILEKFIIPDDDVEASLDLVLITPIDEDGCYEADDDHDTPALLEPEPGSIGAFVNFTISDMPYYSGFRALHCDEKKFVGKLTKLYNDQDYFQQHFEDGVDYTNVNLISNKMYVRLDAFRVLMGRFPEIGMHMLYRVLFRRDSLDWEQCGLMAQDAFWLNVADKNEDEDVELFWLRLLSRTDITPDEIVQEAKMGRGRLYYHSRVDRFPSADYLPSLNPGSGPSVLSKLTFDLLWYLCENFIDNVQDVAALAVLDRATRTFILPHIDRISKRIIELHHPYLFPIGTRDYARGLEEFDEWDRIWKGQSEAWCAYARECRLSPHMKNRARMWRIAGNVRDQISKAGLLPPDGSSQARTQDVWSL